MLYLEKKKESLTILKTNTNFSYTYPACLTYLLSKASVVSLSTKNAYLANNNWIEKNTREMITAGLTQEHDIII